MYHDILATKYDKVGLVCFEITSLGSALYLPSLTMTAGILPMKSHNKKCPIWFTHNFYSFEVAPKLTTDSCNMTYWLQNMTKSVWYVLKSLVWAQPCICPLLQWKQAFCLWNFTKKRPIWFTHNFYSFEVAPKLTTDSYSMTSWLQNMTKSVWYVLKSLGWAQPCICPLLQWQQAFCLWNLTKKAYIYREHTDSILKSKCTEQRLH